MSLRRTTAAMTALAFCLGAVTLGASGCTASASFKAGGGEAKEPEPPPPPPPPKKEEKKKAEKPKKKKKKDKPKAEPKEEKGDKIVTKGDTIMVPGAIVFDSGKATLKAGEQNDEILAQLKAYMDKNENVTLMRIEGHTDDVGTPEDNLKLSGERALTIKKALVERGVKADRLIAVGFGERKPIADNASEEGKAQNRRTVFKIAGLNGKPYMGLKPTGGGTEFK